MQVKYHEDGSQPQNDETFVFGSNLAGAHGAGAAKAARRFYGAATGVGVGKTGASYAIPTKDENINTMPLIIIKQYVDAFVLYAKSHPKEQFFLTAVGCGLAGYTNQTIAPLFYPPLPNVSYPDCWKQYLSSAEVLNFNE